MKKRTVFISAILGTLFLIIPVQSQAFFFGFGFSSGFSGWGYPYYSGYHPGYWGYGGYPNYGYGSYPYHGYGGYPYYAYRSYPLYSYPVAATLPLVSAPVVAEK